MDLVTEKFKQKIAAVFYPRGRKFNQTRIFSTHTQGNSEENHCVLEQRGNSVCVYVCKFLFVILQVLWCQINCKVESSPPEKSCILSYLYSFTLFMILNVVFQN